VVRHRRRTTSGIGDATRLVPPLTFRTPRWRSHARRR